MPDIRVCLKEYMSALGLSGAHEGLIIEELAQDLEERYERALRDGEDPAEAWRRIEKQICELSIQLQSTLGRSAASFPDRRQKQSTPTLPFLNQVCYGLGILAKSQRLDFLYAARRLRKSIGFTAVAVFTLALCLGANLTIFAVIDCILLRPLPFPHADRLVTSLQSYPLAGVARGSASLPNYYDYREQINAFASTAIIHTDYSGPTIVGGAEAPYRVDCDRVSPEFFSTLEVPLRMGRSFTEEEMTYAGSHVAVLTDAFWRSYFNADPQVLGRTFLVDTVATTVIGVLPPNFHFLSRRAQFYTPAASGPSERTPDQRHNNRCQLIARLAAGATLATARAQVAALDAAQLKDDPDAELLKRTGFFTIIDSLHEDHVRAIKPTLLLLECAALLLLLVGGVNLINLLLIRASGRSKELAIRQALGASRWHVVSQVVTETVLLAILGGLFGLSVAAIGIRLLTVLGADQLPLGGYIAFDGRLALVAFSGALVLGTMLAVPVSWLYLRGRLANALQGESRGSTGNRAAQRLRHSFIVAQIASAFVLLTGAGMLGVSLKHLLETSPGFQIAQIFTGQLTLPFSHYQNESSRLSFLGRLAAALHTQPGVLTVGIGSLTPFGGGTDKGVTAVEDVVATRGKSPRPNYRNGVVGDYYQVLGIRLLEGRLLEDADNERPPRVCVVDEAFAHHYWPGKSPLGQRLNDGSVFKPDEAFTIVGVVSSVKQTDLAETDLLGTVYYPYKYWAQPAFSVVVRSTMALESMASLLRHTVLQLDPQLPIDHLKTMRSSIDESLVTRRSPAILAGLFAAVSLILTAVGTYGVLAYAVSQRQREIGVRLALGALPSQVLAQFLGLGAKLLLAGIVLGIFGAWAAGRTIQSFLFGVNPIQPGILAATAGLMVGVVLVATFVPSRRAARVSPLEALRNE